MIGRINGIVLEKSPPHLLIDVQGVGYEMQAPLSTFSNIPEEGKTVILHTHLCIREDAHLLYGFYSKSERILFKALIKINGVGPKLALSILSVMDEKTLIMSIHEQDAAMLTRVPGVGKKTAGRLLVEMQGRIEGLEFHSLDQSAHSVENQQIVQKNSKHRDVTDAINALVALGYSQRDATKAVNEVAEKNKLNREQIIRQALKGKHQTIEREALINDRK